MLPVMPRRFCRGNVVWVAVSLLLPAVGTAAMAGDRFEGEFFCGEGDIEYLQLLDVSRRMFEADPEFQSLGMLYAPAWNGLVEGPTWGAWWIQNSYGPTYCALPIFQEPLLTFLQNAQDLWFDQMGDGKRKGAHDWVAPDGCLCDAAAPNTVIYKQGDGRIDIHDWGMEFTAAGLLMQAELLLIGRDQESIRRYLPRLERCADFIETRRDAKNSLFLAGPAGNLLAPSYAGWKRPDGSHDKAYLAGLSVTYLAALDRLVELEKLAGRADQARLYGDRRQLARKGLPQLLTDEGYFVKYLDPDGTRHGVFGAEKHGYFEAVVNHDAVCFRVVDEAQAARIYAKIASIPGLRPHDVIITNYPALDDMYVPGTGWLWGFGTWVNGGHWSTCEARMIMAYYRLGRHEDARRSMRQLMKFARAFRLDNPLVDFGNSPYQPGEPINLCYDSFGPPAAMIRGLFEYLYDAEGLTLLPHVPPKITRLEQHFPVRFGSKRLYLATVGSGPVTAVLVNGAPWNGFDPGSVRLPYDATPDQAEIQILLGGAEPVPFEPRRTQVAMTPLAPIDQRAWVACWFPPISPNRVPLRFGADSHGGSRFMGEMARARLFSRALKPAEIALLARSRDKSPLDRDPALLGDWAFASPKGNVLPNAVGEHLPARIVGKVKFVETAGVRAVRLEGEGYVEVAHDPRLDLSEACTMEAWIRPGVQPPGGGRIIDKTMVGTSNGYLLDTYPGNSLRLIAERGSLGFDAKLSPGRWVHVVGTIDADGSEALYIDGRRVALQKLTLPAELVGLRKRLGRIATFHERLAAAGMADCYEAAHARLAAAYLAALRERLAGIEAGKLKPLPDPSRSAADRSYLTAAARLAEGLEQAVQRYKSSTDPHRKRVYEIWRACP